MGTASNFDVQDADLFTFAIDPFGNYICMNLSNNEIVFWNHETGKVASTEKDLESFIGEMY